MTRVDESLARITGRVQNIIDTIDRGEDPQTEIARLNQAAPWEQARLGLAAVEDTFERMKEADVEPGVAG